MCLSKFKKWVSKEKEEKSQWQNVLLALYTDATRHKLCEKRDDVSWDDHPLTKKLKIGGKELEDSISFLEEQGFIKQVKLEHSEREVSHLFKIKEKGVDVAIEIKRHRDSVKIPLVVLYYSIILTFAVVLQFFKSLELFTDNFLFYGFFGVLIFVTLGWLVYLIPSTPFD